MTTEYKKAAMFTSTTVKKSDGTEEIYSRVENVLDIGMLVIPVRVIRIEEKQLYGSDDSPVLIFDASRNWKEYNRETKGSDNMSSWLTIKAFGHTAKTLKDYIKDGSTITVHASKIITQVRIDTDDRVMIDKNENPLVDTVLEIRSFDWNGVSSNDLGSNSSSNGDGSSSSSRSRRGGDSNTSNGSGRSRRSPAPSNSTPPPSNNADDPFDGMFG